MSSLAVVETWGDVLLYNLTKQGGYVAQAQ